MVLTAMLKRLGYTPETAENGQQAVALAENRAYDLILMVSLSLVYQSALTAVRQEKLCSATRNYTLAALSLSFASQPCQSQCLTLQQN